MVESIDAAVELQILQYGEVGIEAELLRHVTDTPFDQLGIELHIVSEDGRVTGGGREDSKQHADDCRLATAIGTEQAEDRTTADLKAHIADGNQAAEVSREMPHIDDEVTHGPTPTEAARRRPTCRAASDAVDPESPP